MPITVVMRISTNLCLIKDFVPVNQRIATILTRAKFYHISIVYVQYPTEEKDDVLTEAFDAKFDDVYEKCAAHYFKNRPRHLLQLKA